MDIDLGMVRLNIATGGNAKVQYNATPVMVNAAMVEARRLGVNIAESDMHKLLQAALNKG